MHVFVTGATGVLGHAVVPLLIAGGHRVRALSRSVPNEALLRERGIEPVPADLFEPASLVQALADCEAVLHLASKIPPTSHMRRRAAWQENDRIRREGTRNLVVAAQALGVQTLVYPSICLLYPDSHNEWVAANSTAIAPHELMRSTVDAEAEVRAFTTEGHRGIVLRMGAFYGPESPLTQEQLRLARLGMVAFPGASEAYFSHIWIQDAARALMAALTEAPAGIYDIVEDEPLPRRELFAAMAHGVGRKRLLRLPQMVVQMLLGSAAGTLNRSQRVCNRHFKEISGWKPLVPNAHVGWSILGQARHKASTSP